MTTSIFCIIPPRLRTRLDRDLTAHLHRSSTSSTVYGNTLGNRVKDVVQRDSPACESGLQLSPMRGREGPGSRARDVEGEEGLRESTRDELCPDRCTLSVVVVAEDGMN